MLLGIGLHASLAFIPFPWPVQDRTSGLEGFYDEFFWAVHGFRMPVFFLMSGFFTAMLWRRRGLRSLLGHRLRRVALPLALGMLTIVPLTTWAIVWAVESGAKAASERGDIVGAVFAGDVPGVEDLLDRGFDVDQRTEPDGWTLLHSAAFTGNGRMVEMLLSRGAEPAPTAPASEGETPLGVAFYFGHEEAADLLVAYGGGDPLPEGMKWSDIPGWGEGAGGSEEEEEEAAAELDLSEITRFYHLWFLWFLLWLAAGFAVLAWAAGLRERRRLGPPAAPRPWPRWVMWSMIPLTLLPQLAMGGGGAYPVFGPDTSDGLIPFPHVLLYYACFFAFGALMYGRPGAGGGLVSDRMGRFWRLTLPASVLIALPAGLAFTGILDFALIPRGQVLIALPAGLAFTFDPRPFYWPAASVLQVLYAWGMCLGLIGLFRALLGRERRGVRYLSDSSYWLYLAHLPLMVAAQVLVRDWPLPSGVKFLGMTVGVTLVLLACYRLFIRYTPIGALLNGKKTRPTRPAPNPDARSRV